MTPFPREVDGQRFLRAMGRFGWRVTSQHGSHRKLEREGQAGFLLVAFHRTLGRNSVRRTLRQAGIAEEEFLREL